MDRALWSFGRAPEQDSAHCIVQIKQGIKREEEAVVDVLSRVILTGLTQASSWWSVVALDADDDKWWILG